MENAGLYSLVFAASFIGSIAAISLVGLGRYTMTFKKDSDVPLWVWGMMLFILLTVGAALYGGLTQ